ncbi:MAG: hypothetical protein KJ749_10620, partial [Planctomycetes bacterium]|nr:hypothetical protein [Planctomycetota bacterium]
MRIKRRRHAIPDSIKLTHSWHRQVLVVSVVALLAAGIVCERSARGPIQNDDQSRYHNRTFRVARVIDGDTLDIAVPDGDQPV